MQKEKPVNINNTIEITRNYYNKVSLWRSQGFLNGWTGEISKRRVLPSLRILNLKDGHKWLDMGCSNGFNINLGLSMNKKNNKNNKENKKSEKIHIHGIDISDANIKIAKKKIRKGNFRVGNVEKLPYTMQFFDRITYLHVVEHVRYPLQSLTELKRVLKDDGKAVLSFHNKYGLENSAMGFSKKLIFIFGGDKGGFSKPKGMLDVRRSIFEIRRMCIKAGLKVTRTDGCIVMLPSLAWRIAVLRKPTLFLSDILEKLPLTKYLSSYISIELKKK